MKPLPWIPIVLLAPATNLIAARALDPPASEEVIERYVRQEIQINRIPGLELAVVLRQQVWLRAWGVRSLRNRRPITVDTPVELASVSKPFTAIAAAQLVEAGRLDWDQPASVWLPALRGGPLAGVTLRDLLRHRSGLRRSHDRLAAGADPGAAWDLAGAVSRLARARPRRAPGTSFGYANSNYVLLAALVEAASGLRFADYMATRVFAPLGLERTTLDDEAARSWGVAELHELAWGRVRPAESRQTGWLGASRVKSTARDLSAWMRAMLAGRVAGLRRPDLLEPPYDSGWFVWTRADWAGGRRALEHSGDIWGANAAVVLVPEAGLGVAVLINAGLNHASDIARGVVRAVLTGAAPLPSRPPWVRVADNWAMIFLAASSLATAGLIWYWLRLAQDLRRGRRAWAWPAGWWERGRLVLLAAMAAYLTYLATGRPAGAISRPPASLRLALPLLAAAAAAALLTAGLAAVLRPRDQD